MQTKSGGKEFLKSHIGLSSCHLTMHLQAGPSGWIYWCMSAQPSSGQCRNAKIFRPSVLVIKNVQNIFFPKTCNASKILSMDSQCDQVVWNSDFLVEGCSIPLWLEVISQIRDDPSLDLRIQGPQNQTKLFGFISLHCLQDHFKELIPFFKTLEWTCKTI